jgi:uncharacterized membrane protein
MIAARVPGCVREETDMSENPIQVFIAVYDGEFQAVQSLKDFQSMHREGSIDLIDAAVIVHTAEGKVKFEETADPSGKRWAKRGAIAGGLVGLIFPPSIILSAAVGGGAGAIWGRLRDKGFKDEDLKELGESMEPGTSAIIAIAEDHVIERLEQGLEGYERIARHTVSAEAALAITAIPDAPGEAEAAGEAEPAEEPAKESDSANRASRQADQKLGRSSRPRRCSAGGLLRGGSRTRRRRRRAGARIARRSGCWPARRASAAPRSVG